jgi:hypothetical protein
VDTSNPLLTYWYFHLPNFILAVLMYTLLGRALLSTAAIILGGTPPPSMSA